jgi:hypothetical protein
MVRILMFPFERLSYESGATHLGEVRVHPSIYTPVSGEVLHWSNGQVIIQFSPLS